jgi:polysaccharide biosynthesis/export protein
MNRRTVKASCLLALVCCLAGLISTGCRHTVKVCEADMVSNFIPRELQKQPIPEYVIEPPDILLVDAVAVIPKPPYRVAPGDILLARVANAFESDPISGAFPIEPDGTINLGASYGSISITGKTIAEARSVVEDALSKIIKEPKVFLALAQSRGLQQVRGQHLVTPDGYVRLGLYGAAKVVGLTVAEAKKAIEAHLSQYLEAPEISLDVIAYNSKLYYVIFDGGGNGQTILRLPVTGNDTVLDAIAQAGGLTAVSAQQIWVARPAPAGACCDQILPVDWCGITTRGRTATNYQLFPGDRLYVKADPLITTNTRLTRIFAPIERVLGITLLGNSTYRAVVAPLNNNGNNSNTGNNSNNSNNGNNGLFR